MSNTTRKIFYETTTACLTTLDNAEYTAYGISAFCLECGNTIKLDEIIDVSTDLKFVNELVEKFNHFELHIEHFRDTVYDFVCSELSL